MALLINTQIRNDLFATGSITASGSIIGHAGFTGSLQGTASWAVNATTAGTAEQITAQTAVNNADYNIALFSANSIWTEDNFVYNPVSQSLSVPNITGSLRGTSSFAVSASRAVSAANAVSAAFATNATNATNATTLINGATSQASTFGQTSHRVDTLAISSSGWTDMQVGTAMQDGTMAFVKVIISGIWSAGDPVGYYGEFMLQKAVGGAAPQPGIIVREVNNNSANKYIQSQILDPGVGASGDLVMQFRTAGASATDVLADIRTETMIWGISNV